MFTQTLTLLIRLITAVGLMLSSLSARFHLAVGE